MTTIGTFQQRSENYYEGTIEAPQVSGLVIIEAVAYADRGHGLPDFRLYSGPYEIGAAWERAGAAGATFLSVVLNAPGFTAPLHCRLQASGAGFDLVLLPS